MEWREHVRRAIGCPNPLCHVNPHNCMLKHVEVTLYDGTVIFAEPEKCNWYCAVAHTAMPLRFYTDNENQYMPCQRYHWSETPQEYADCGYQPRWDVINQEQPDA